MVFMFVCVFICLNVYEHVLPLSLHVQVYLSKQDTFSVLIKYVCVCVFSYCCLSK